jgi:predicted RNA-binding protein with PIN domain
MPYLIDGHNLIPKIPGLALGDIDVEISLIKILQEYCRKRRITIDVFFDKAPPVQAGTRKHGQVTAHYIRQTSSADAAIISRLQKAGRSARNMTVVTSDREVASASKDMGAKVIPSQDFVRNHLLHKPGNETNHEKDTDPNIDNNEVDYWLTQFDKK